MSNFDRRQLPSGPREQFDSADDLLVWIGEHFDRYGDIYRASVYGRDVYVVTSPEYVQHVLVSNWKNYVRKGQAIKRISILLGRGLISSNGEFWFNQRRMMQAAFSRKAIMAQSTVIASANEVLLDKWRRAAQSKISVNVTKDISRMVLEVTLRAIFGSDYPGIAAHFEIVSERSRDLQFAQMFRELGKVIVDVISTRRSRKISGTDILGLVMQTRNRSNGNPMPDAQLAREVMTLIIAGHETTASVLNWAWYLLSRHPTVDAKVADEIRNISPAEVPRTETFDQYVYTQQVINEALRLYPPLWLMTRRSVNDDHLGKFFVPAGTDIYISPYMIQRHPQFWELPNTFDPDRFNHARVGEGAELQMCPFGAGPRKCVGEALARSEIQMHLMLIARDMRLRNDEPDTPKTVAGVNLLSRQDFFMTPEIRPS